MARKIVELVGDESLRAVQKNVIRQLRAVTFRCLLRKTASIKISCHGRVMERIGIVTEPS
jgi:hypothetical protein